MTTDLEQAASRQVARPTAKQALTQLLDQNKGAVGASLPTGYSQERFSRLLLTAANTNPDLFKCDPRSFLAAGVGAAQLGLEPNDARGLAYLIPFGKKCNLIIGYRGMLDLARRSGMVGAVSAHCVYKGDTFTYSFGLEPTLHHVPDENGAERDEDITHVYATAKVNGEPQFVVLTRNQIDKTKANSQGAKSKMSPWNSGYYAEMAAKTALRRLCKYLPQTVEMAESERLDGADLSLGDMGLSVEHGDTDDDAVIDVPSEESAT